jgi:hypothetical protein
MKTTEHNDLIHIKARVRMLESMIYRLYTNKELSTGQMNELVRIVLKENPDYFKEVKDGEIK